MQVAAVITLIERFITINDLYEKYVNSLTRSFQDPNLQCVWSGYDPENGYWRLDFNTDHNGGPRNLPSFPTERLHINMKNQILYRNFDNLVNGKNLTVRKIIEYFNLKASDFKHTKYIKEVEQQIVKGVIKHHYPGGRGAPPINFDQKYGFAETHLFFD